MAKKSGLGSELYVSGYNLSGDTGALNEIADVVNHRENQGINSSATTRMQLTRQGHISFTSFFNDAAGRSIPVLKNPPTTNVVATFLQGTTVGDASCGISGKYESFAGNRGADGSLDLTSRIDANGFPCVEWGKTLTAGRRTDTSATNGAGCNFVSGSSFGLAAYLHTANFAGTSATVQLQESSDNGSGDAWANVTGGAFTAVSSDNTSQRIETSLTQTVEKFLRATTFGTFTEFEFQCTAIIYNTGDRNAAP